MFTGPLKPLLSPVSVTVPFTLATMLNVPLPLMAPDCVQNWFEPGAKERTLLLIIGLLPEPESASVPAETVRAPVWLRVPLSITVPGPTLVRLLLPPLSEIAPEIVRVIPDSEPMLVSPAKVTLCDKVWELLLPKMAPPPATP